MSDSNADIVRLLLELLPSPLPFNDWNSCLHALLREAGRDPVSFSSAHWQTSMKTRFGSTWRQALQLPPNLDLLLSAARDAAFALQSDPTPSELQSQLQRLPIPISWNAWQRFFKLPSTTSYRIYLYTMRKHFGSNWNSTIRSPAAEEQALHTFISGKAFEDLDTADRQTPPDKSSRKAKSLLWTLSRHVHQLEVTLSQAQCQPQLPAPCEKLLRRASQQLLRLRAKLAHPRLRPRPRRVSATSLKNLRPGKRSSTHAWDAPVRFTAFSTLPAFHLLPDRMTKSLQPEMPVEVVAFFFSALACFYTHQRFTSLIQYHHDIPRLRSQTYLCLPGHRVAETQAMILLEC